MSTAISERVRPVLYDNCAVRRNGEEYIVTLEGDSFGALNETAARTVALNLVSDVISRPAIRRLDHVRMVDPAGVEITPFDGAGKPRTDLPKLRYLRDFVFVGA